MKIAVDLDDTLTMPHQANIDRVKELIEAGHQVYIYTSRPESIRDHTRQWLDRNGLAAVPLVMDKPAYDLLVDDRALPEFPPEVT